MKKKLLPLILVVLWIFLFTGVCSGQIFAKYYDSGERDYGVYLKSGEPGELLSLIFILKKASYVFIQSSGDASPSNGWLSIWFVLNENDESKNSIRWIGISDIFGLSSIHTSFHTSIVKYLRRGIHIVRLYGRSSSDSASVNHHNIVVTVYSKGTISE